MNCDNIIAKRYAQAFLNMFIGTLTDNDFTTLTAVINFFEEHRPVCVLLKVPHIPASMKTDALEEILITRFHLSPCFKKLIQLLAQQRRTSIIVQVLEHMHMLYQQHKNIETFHIESSHPLDQRALAIVQEFLAQHTNRTVLYTHSINPSLIAGIRVYSPTLLWEYSINKQLNLVSHG